MADDKKKIYLTSPDLTIEDLQKADKEIVDSQSPLIKTIVNSLHSNEKITRLVFEEDPNNQGRFAGLYYEKINLIPDRIIKRLRVVDDLLATIIRLRGNQISAFGVPLTDRFSTGYRLDPIHPAIVAKLSEEEQEDLADRVRRVTAAIATCGDPKRWDDTEKLAFQTYLYLQSCNAVSFGRFATEIVYLGEGPNRKFNSFRPADPGTIYKTLPNSHEAKNVREMAFTLLEQVKNANFQKERFTSGKLDYVQVIEGRGINAFTSDEMVVHTVYPVTDIELNGYPVTPIDTAIAAITTHINITSHNKLYFASGRAAKGMVVITSDNIDPSTLNDLKQQFVAQINGVSNSHRIPIFKVGKEDGVSWQSIESQNKDMDFQYLLDSNYRIILSAFHMSPDEVPGFGYLSKGTNAQALNESSQEWKLEAARDVGIRPLLASIENFVNERLLPLFDEKVAKYCKFKFYGLEALTQDQELNSLEHRQNVYDTINDTLRAVDKKPYPKELAGDFLLNPRFGQVLDQYFTVGEIKEYFMGIKDASKRPEDAYRRCPFFFQWQMVLQQQQAQKQMEQEAQRQAQQAPESNEPNGPPQGKDQPEKGQQGDDGAELMNGIDQALSHLSKAEAVDLKKQTKKLWVQHEEIVKKTIDEWDKESEVMLAELATVINNNKKD